MYSSLKAMVSREDKIIVIEVTMKHLLHYIIECNLVDRYDHRDTWNEWVERGYTLIDNVPYQMQ